MKDVLLWLFIVCVSILSFLVSVFAIVTGQIVEGAAFLALSLGLRALSLEYGWEEKR